MTIKIKKFYSTENFTMKKTRIIEMITKSKINFPFIEINI